MSATAFRQQVSALGRLPHRNVFWRERVSLSYAGDVLGAVARDALVVLAAVEGIFISEFLISELLPRVLDYGGGLVDVLFLTVMALPSGFYLALPLAILIACYLVLLRRRESSEFTVLAGMGYSSRLLVGLCLVVAILGFLASSFVTGFLEPHARYLMRKGFFDVAIEELRSGEIAAGKFHVFGDMAVFAARGRLGNRATGVFVHEHLDGERNRIVRADRSLGLSSTGGRKAILLDDATVLNFDLAVRGADCAGCTPALRLTPANIVNLNRFFVAAPQLPLPETSPRGVGASSEATTLEALAVAGQASGLLGQRLLRAALCFLAPFLALAAVAVTGPRTLLFALPAAAAIVLGGTFFGPSMVDRLTTHGTGVTLGIVAAATALAAGIAIAISRWREPKLLNPARVRL